MSDDVDLLVRLAMDAKKYSKQLKNTAGKTASWAKGVTKNIGLIGLGAGKAIAENWGDIQQSLIDIAKFAITSIKNITMALITSTDEQKARYQAIVDTISGMKSMVMEALTPIGDALLSLAEKAMPVLQEIMTSIMPVIEAFAKSFSEQLLPAAQAIAENIRRIFDAMGLTNKEMSTGQVAAQALTGVFTTLERILKGVVAVTAAAAWAWENFGPILKILLAPIYLLVAAFKALYPAGVLVGKMIRKIDTAVKSISGPISRLVSYVKKLGSEFSKLDIPDWLTPGSPTPLEIGIRGINKAVNQMKPMDFSTNANMGNLTTAGASGGGGGVSFGDINVSGGNVDVDEATRQFANLLRSKLKDGQ